MLRRLHSPQILYLLAVLAWPTAAQAGGRFVTANFVVSAANDQVARKVGEYAEKWRREKAMEWLGREMPGWGRPCPLKVTVTAAGSSGETTFAFDNGTILDQQMHVAGSLEHILDSVLPHEITHTVFAYRFRRPLPRWADEGGSVLSEDEGERNKHDDLIRRLLAKGNQAYRLRYLMPMMQYPTQGNRPGEDVITLYAQGYSIVRFMVESSSKRVFLDFLADALQPEIGWDRALLKHYDVQNIEELEKAWLKWMLDWYSPHARLMKQGDSHVSGVVAANTTASGQAQAARVTTPNKGALGSPMTQNADGGIW